MRTQNYRDLDVASFLRDIGMRKVRAHSSTGWVGFCCPFHDDRNPSAGMNMQKTTWTCHVCQIRGNAATLLAMLKGISTRQAHHRLIARDYHREVEEPPTYERRTQRQTTGTTREIHEQSWRAAELVMSGMRYCEIRSTLVNEYKISRATAERRLRVVHAFLKGGNEATLGARERRAWSSSSLDFKSSSCTGSSASNPMNTNLRVKLDLTVAAPARGPAGGRRSWQHPLFGDVSAAPPPCGGPSLDEVFRGQEPWRQEPTTFGFVFDPQTWRWTAPRDGAANERGP
jgi:hypothetical protein